MHTGVATVCGRSLKIGAGTTVMTNGASRWSFGRGHAEHGAIIYRAGGFTADRTGPVFDPISARMY